MFEALILVLILSREITDAACYSGPMDNWDWFPANDN